MPGRERSGNDKPCSDRADRTEHAEPADRGRDPGGRRPARGE